MNLVECCARYVADASSIIMQHTAQTQKKKKTQSSECENKTKQVKS